MKVIIAFLLILVLADPAYAWRPGPYYYPGPYCGCGYRRISPGAAAGLVGVALVAGVLAGLLIGNAIANNHSQGELAMLDSAVRANQYKNYLIGLSYYNARASQQLGPLTKEQWVRWRVSNGLETIK